MSSISSATSDELRLAKYSGIVYTADAGATSVAMIVKTKGVLIVN